MGGLQLSWPPCGRSWEGIRLRSCPDPSGRAILGPRRATEARQLPNRPSIGKVDHPADSAAPVLLRIYSIDMCVCRYIFVSLVDSCRTRQGHLLAGCLFSNVFITETYYHITKNGSCQSRIGSVCIICEPCGILTRFSVESTIEQYIHNYMYVTCVHSSHYVSTI